MPGDRTVTTKITSGSYHDAALPHQRNELFNGDRCHNPLPEQLGHPSRLDQLDSDESEVLSLAGAVVALAFMAQLSGMGMQFNVFALVLLPTMLFIGLVTFERLVQLQLENLNCVRAINRIRHYYMEVAPEIAPHLTLSPFDDMRGMMTSLGSYRERLEWWQIFVTNAGMIAVARAVAVLVVMVAWTALSEEFMIVKVAAMRFAPSVVSMPSRGPTSSCPAAGVPASPVIAQRASAVVRTRPPRSTPVPKNGREREILINYGADSVN